MSAKGRRKVFREATARSLAFKGFPDEFCMQIYVFRGLQQIMSENTPEECLHFNDLLKDHPLKILWRGKQLVLMEHNPKFTAQFTVPVEPRRARNREERK